MEKRTEFDRISNLPWDVLDTILVHLPLRDAARTSVLSSKWRYKWTGLSQFTIDDKCFPSSLYRARWGQVMEIIHQVQVNHSGPIEKFKLSAYCCPDYSDLDQWLLFLTERGIKEIVLRDFGFFKLYKVPPSLFSCPQLTSLELYGCIFKLPSAFKGFNCLKTLQLTQVSIISNTLESLVHNCPILEKLILVDITHLAFLRIHNRNLKYLKIDSEFEDICLSDCPVLATVDIHMTPMYGGILHRHVELGKYSNVVRVLGGLYGIKKLALSGQFLEFLANDDIPERLPRMLNQLSYVELKELCFGTLKGLVTFFSILRSSPNLKELVISVGQSNQPYKPIIDFLKALCQSDFFFSQLKVVRIRGIRGTRSEWEFVKLILAHSPALEDMYIVKYGGQRIPEMTFLQMDRASQHVKITSLTL